MGKSPKNGTKKQESLFSDNFMSWFNGEVNERVDVPEASLSCSVCGPCTNVSQCICGQVAYCGEICRIQDWERHGQDCPIVVVRDVEVKGKGLVATRDIPAGTVILTEDPLLVIERAAVVSRDEYHKFQMKDENLKNDFMSLSDPLGLEMDERWIDKLELNEREEPDLVKFWRIFSVNSVAIGVDKSSWLQDQSKTDNYLSGVYKKYSRINHSCSANVIQYWKKEAPHKIEVRAAAHIMKGEELTVNYLGGLFGTWAERRHKLMKSWSFMCMCEVCSLPELKKNKNDTVRKFIVDHMLKDATTEVHDAMTFLPIKMVDNLRVLLACYSIEREAKHLMPEVLWNCHLTYKIVQMLMLTWECPEDVGNNLVEKLGIGFLEILDREAVTKADMLGSVLHRSIPPVLIAALENLGEHILGNKSINELSSQVKRPTDFCWGN